MKEVVCGKSCSFKLLQEIWPTGSFLNNNIVWLAHESDESMCKPSNLKEVTLSMVPVGVVRNGRFERAIILLLSRK